MPRILGHFRAGVDRSSSLQLPAPQLTELVQQGDGISLADIEHADTAQKPPPKERLTIEGRSVLTLLTSNSLKLCSTDGSSLVM